MYHIGGASGGPWMADVNITDAWVADAKYLDSTGSVGIWKPQKGTINLIQPTGASKPLYSAAWGSSGKGELTFDGIDDYMSGDALASRISGNPARDFTIIDCFELIAVTVVTKPWAFSASSNTSTLITLNPQNATIAHPGSPTNLWQVNNYDDAADANATTANTVVAVASVPLVVTTIYQASAFRLQSLRINGAPVAIGTANTLTFGQTSLTRFTVGAFRGATTINFCHMRQRALLFSQSLLPAASYRPAENYLIAEAA